MRIKDFIVQTFDLDPKTRVCGTNMSLDYAISHPDQIHGLEVGSDGSFREQGEVQNSVTLEQIYSVVKENQILSVDIEDSYRYQEITKLVRFDGKLLII